MGSESGPDPLVRSIRNLLPREFEAIVAELPARWSETLLMHGVDRDQGGFGVVLKARWQNFPADLRDQLTLAVGATAERKAAEAEVSPRIADVAAAFAGVEEQERLARPSGPDPGVLAELLTASTSAAEEAVATAVAALDQGRPCPDDVTRAVREYNSALAAAQALLADRGAQPVPEGRSALLAALQELAATAAREPLRQAVADLATVEGDLPVIRQVRRRSDELLQSAPAEWTEEQVQVAQGLAALVELRRLAAAGGGAATLLALSARAQAALPAELHGLVVLAASGSFSLRPALTRPAATAEAGGVDTAVA
jgi:hypothetical protein